MNDFNWTIAAGLRCNHDIKYLGKSINQSLSVMYYLTNYITKNGISSYNALLYDIMALKKHQQYIIEPSTESHKAMKLFNGIYNCAANYTEYSAPQVANMMLNNGRDGTYYSSHLVNPIQSIKSFMLK